MLVKESSAKVTGVRESHFNCMIVDFVWCNRRGTFPIRKKTRTRPTYKIPPRNMTSMVKMDCIQISLLNVMVILSEMAAVEFSDSFEFIYHPILPPNRGSSFATQSK